MNLPVFQGTPSDCRGAAWSSCLPALGPRSCRAGGLALIVLVCQVAHAVAQFPSSELQAISQPVAAIGKTFELSVSGTQLNELQALLFSCSAVTATPVADPPAAFSDAPRPTNRFKVTVADEATAGACEVRTLGRFGVSNPRRLWLTRKEVALAGSDHRSSAVALSLDPNKIFVTNFQAQQQHFYQLELSAGDSIRIAAYANQLDSRARPVVILRGAEGQELARSRAVGNWPAAINYHAAANQPLTLVVYDAIYQGGPEYAYALECSRGSQVAEAPALELDGLISPSLEATVEVASQPSTESPASTSAAKSPLGYDKLERIALGPQSVATTPASSNSPLPIHWRGTLPADGSAWSHDFEARQGEQLSVQVLSHSVGQLTDPRLVVYRVLPAQPEAGGSGEQVKQVAEQDDPASLGDAAAKVNFRDPRLVWKVPEDGRYRLEIFDNENSPRPDHQRQFAASIEVAQPQFQLLAFAPLPNNNPAQTRPYELNLLAGGSASLRVIAIRHGDFAAPIEVSLSDLPEGVAAPAMVLHPNQPHIDFVLSCSESVKPWCGPIQVVGRAVADSSPAVPAYTATVSWPAIPVYNVVQNRLSADLMLCISSLDTAPISITVGGPEVVEVKQGEKLSLPIRLTRRAGGDVACTLRARNLIPKVTAPDVTIAADKAEGNCEVTVAADAPLGEFSLYLSAESKLKWRDNPQSLTRAEEHLAKLNMLLAAEQDASQKTKLDEAIKQTTTEVENLKKSTAEKEITVWLPSSTQRIRVVGKQ